MQKLEMEIQNTPSTQLQMKYLFIPLIMLLLLLCGCFPPRPVCVKDGKKYCVTDGTFGYEWFDYYERALSCMEGEFYQQALSDLDEAIKQRFKDKRMAKTYGMHLRDYFPHREKGLVYYLTGEYGNARQELELSVQDEKSAKAFFYLDKVRKKIMELEKEAVSSPYITVTTRSGKDEIWTRDDPVMVSGTAEDRQYVSEINLAGKSVFLEFSGQRVEFEEKLILSQGRHEIEIIARNLLNGAATQRIIINVDRSGPVIILGKFDPDIGLQGYIYDESGEISLLADDKNIPVLKGKEAGFSVPVKPGTQSVKLLATDKLGNQTRADVTLEMLAESDSRNSEYFPHPLLLAQRASNTATDARENNSRYLKPEIILNGLHDKKTVFTEIISVKGQVSGKTDIEEVLINNTQVHRKPGRIIFFNHSVRLNIGENRIAIRARDESGRETVKKITIVRQIPEVLRPEYRRIFITHLFQSYSSGHTDRKTQEGVLFQYLFLERLTGRNRFQVALDKELEKKFHTQEFNPDRITKARKKLQADPLMLTGYIYNTRNGVEIVAQIIDMETSEVINMENENTNKLCDNNNNDDDDKCSGYPDIYFPAIANENTRHVPETSEIRSEKASELESASGRLAEKLHRAFPLVKGKIIQQQGKSFLADMELGEMSIKWPFVVGSGPDFTGEACIDDKLSHEKCLIRLTDRKEDESVVGHMIVSQ